MRVIFFEISCFLLLSVRDTVHNFMSVHVDFDLS